MTDGQDNLTAEQRSIDTALLAYWTSREDARVASIQRGTTDVGGRVGVTSGGHLDNIAHLLANACREVGVREDHLFYKRPAGVPGPRVSQKAGFTLPGHFRPDKQWDLVVRKGVQARPLVVVELKSQNGPSYGNNANNRAEEAIGNAYDYRKVLEATKPSPRPWLGYVFVIEDDVASRGLEDEPADLFADIDVAEERWGRWTYQTRVRDLCKYLVQDRLYDAAWAIASARPDCPDPVFEASIAMDIKDLKCVENKGGAKRHLHAFSWTELEPDVTGYHQFVAGMQTQLRTRY